MKIIDSHVHMDRMAGEDILRMAWGGVEAAIVPTPHLMSGLFYPQSVIDLWDKTLGYMVEYSASMGVDIYATIAVPFYGITAEGYEECLKAMPQYLSRDRVVGIGEIGLDNGNEHEVRLFKTQLEMAKEYDLPVIVHTPTPREPQVPEVTEQCIDVMKEMGFPLERAIIDHTGKNTFNTRINSGAVTGLSVCYDKLTAEEAAALVINNPDKREKIVIGSELGYGGAGHLSLVKVAWVMRMEGLSRNDIEAVMWDNPKRFFNLPLE
ncbi:MAG: TatD family hydrolase [Deltaproteobacteria bacterium]|nr:TatD family hydrolase [Deltaproteobacteria bacterium]